MDETTQVMFCIIAVMLTLLLGVLGAVLWKKRQDNEHCRKCMVCVSDPARSSNERSHAIDGMAEFSDYNPNVHALLRASLNEADPLVRTRAAAVLIPSPLSEIGANPQKVPISRRSGLPEELLPFAQFVYENFVELRQRGKCTQLNDGAIRILPPGTKAPDQTEGAANSPAIGPTINFKKRNRYFWQAIVYEQAIVNGQPESQYAAIELSSLVISRDGTSWAYAAKRMKTEWTYESRWVVVSNGVESRAYEHIFEISFSPDGKKLGYTVKDGAQYYAVVDGKRYPGSKTPVHGIAFNHD